MSVKRICLAILPVVLAVLLVGAWLEFLPHPRVVQAASILCVRPSGGGGCYTTITQALAVAQAGDTIRVAEGIYVENPAITRTLTLEGGWDTTFTQRDPAVYISTIQPADPTLSVVTVDGQYANWGAVAPILDGFTITGGRGDLGGSHGGGVRLRDTNAVLRNNHIHGNVAFLLGGGVWVQRGAPLIQNNRIENNRVTPSGAAYGGGIELENAHATILDNVISNNAISATVGYGGGIAVDDGTVTLTHNTVAGNIAANLAGAPTDYSYGGGVSLRYASGALTDNLIQANTASSVGRGFGGGVYISQSPAFTMTTNVIISNTGGYTPGSSPYLTGGGLLVESSQGKLSGDSLVQNQANRNTIFGNGGGLAAITSTLQIQGGQVISNSVSRNCEGYGGGLYFRNSSLTLDATRIEDNCAANTPFYGKGGGLAFINSPYTLTNALIVQNYAFGNDTAVGGVFAGANSPGLLVNNTLANNRGQGIRTGSAITLTNNIIMGHTTGISLTVPVPVSVTYNDFYANTTNQRGFSLGITNIVINPQLDAGYHLTGASPLIDAATRSNVPGKDMDGEARIMRGASGYYRVDIGSDEFTGQPQIIADVSQGQADLTIIGPGGEEPTNGRNDWIGSSVFGGDVNGDGHADLLTSAHDWAKDPDNPPFTVGRVFGLSNFGGRITGTLDLLTSRADLTVTSNLLLQHIGAELASGDLNQDGRPDLLIGSSQDDGGGGGAVTPTLYTLWGGSTLTGTHSISTTLPADFELRAPGQDFFAFAIQNALASADINADGVDDLVVGDALANDASTAGTGAVFAIFGSGGLSGIHDLATMPADFTLFGPGATAGLGGIAVGQVDTGAQIDLLARSDTSAYILLGPISSGAIHLSSQPANIVITGLQAGASLIADLTGDGQPDVILGSGDQIYVIPGPLVDGESFNADSRAALTMTGVTARALASGNLVGDETPDLLVGAPVIQQSFVFQGGEPVSGAHSIYDLAEMVVTGSAKNLGNDVAIADLDRDGALDWIVGSYGVDVLAHPDQYQDAGAIYLFYGAEIPAPVFQALSGVVISGPLTGTIGLSYTFNANISPITATLPITYTWSPMPASGQGTPTAVYSWGNSAVQLISVTAANPVSEVSDTHSIDIAAPPPSTRYIYLPVTLRE